MKSSQVFSRAVTGSVWSAAQAAVDNRKPLPLQDGLYLAYVSKGTIREVTPKSGSGSTDPYPVVEFELQFVAKHCGEDTDHRPVLAFVDTRREGDPQQGKQFRIDQCKKQTAFFIRETENQSVEDVLVRLKTFLEIFLDVNKLAVDSDFDASKHLMTLEQSIPFVGAWRPYCLVDFRTNGKWQNLDLRMIVQDGEAEDGTPVNDLSVAFEVLEASGLPYVLPRPSEDAGWKAIGVAADTSVPEEPAPEAEVPFETAPAPSVPASTTPAPARSSVPKPTSKPERAVAPAPAPAPLAADPDLDALLALEANGLPSADPALLYSNATPEVPFVDSTDLPDDELLNALEEDPDGLLNEEPVLQSLAGMSRVDLVKLWSEEKKYKIENGYPADTIPKLTKSATDADIIKAICTISPETYTA